MADPPIKAPLYVEELTKMLLESELLREHGEHYTLTGSLTDVAIPATLQDSLMARLDRLPTVRELAQIGAVLGREFAYDMIQALSVGEETLLEERLGQLVDAELLYQRRRVPRAKYIFRHALIRDAAYTSLLRRTRHQYHKQVAELFEANFPEIVEMQPELLAHHYTEADAGEAAVGYWKLAGERALARSAHLEAIGHLTKGLEVLSTLPETPERMQQELSLQISLGIPLTSTRGYGVPEVEQAYFRARALCQQVGETPQLFPALYGLWRYYLLRAEYETAQELGEELMALAEQAEDPTFIAAGHRTLGSTLFYLGELDKARTHLERVITSEVPARDRTQAFLYDVVDATATCRSYAAWTLWLQGYPDQARQLSDDAIATSQELKPCV